MKTFFAFIVIKLQIAVMFALGVNVYCSSTAAAQVIFTQTGNFTPTEAVGDAGTAQSVGIVGSTAMVCWGTEPSGGSVYVLERAADGQWVQQQVLTPSNPQPGTGFGLIAMNASRAIISRSYAKKYYAPTQEYIPSVGDAFIFEKQPDGMWVEVAGLSAFVGPQDELDLFGSSVALDGDSALVGIPLNDLAAVSDCGTAQLFERQADGSWVATADFVASDPQKDSQFGMSVAIAGNIVAIGAPSYTNSTDKVVGAVYIYEKNVSGVWNQTVKFEGGTGNAITGDFFGFAVAASGNLVTVGAPLHDANGLNGAGAVYVYERQTSGSWVQITKLVHSASAVGDHFGFSLSMDANKILAGAYLDSTAIPKVSGHGSAALFERTESGQFVQIAKLSPKLQGNYMHEYQWAGYAVALSGDYAVVGAPNFDGPGQNELSIGTAYFYQFYSSIPSKYGTGTPGCHGVQTMSVNKAPMPGISNFKITCNNAPASSLGLGIITNAADVAGSDPFQLGVLFHVALGQSSEPIGFDMLSNNPAFPNLPTATVGMTVPSNPLLIGESFYAMSLWYWDPLVYTNCTPSPNQLSTSRGIKFTVLAQ